MRGSRRSGVSHRVYSKEALQNERIAALKKHLPSSIILIIMAASATAMPTMKSGDGGAAPTAKNHEKLISNLKLTDKEAQPARKILVEYRKDPARWAAKHGGH